MSSPSSKKRPAATALNSHSRSAPERSRTEYDYGDDEGAMNSYPGIPEDVQDYLDSVNQGLAADSMGGEDGYQRNAKTTGVSNKRQRRPWPATKSVYTGRY